jgi:hypothetical protein
MTQGNAWGQQQQPQQQQLSRWLVLELLLLTEPSTAADHVDGQQACFALQAVPSSSGTFSTDCGSYSQPATQCQHAGHTVLGSDQAAVTSKWSEVFRPSCVSLQDKDASDSMVPCCQLLGFNALLQHAVRLIRGLEITMHSGCINVSVCSFISWFKVRPPAWLLKKSAAIALLAVLDGWQSIACGSIAVQPNYVHSPLCCLHPAQQQRFAEDACCPNAPVVLCPAQITERYPIDGSEVKNNRRDMRGGEGSVSSWLQASSG